MDSLLRRHEEVYGWSWRAIVLLRFTKRGVALVHHHTMSRRLFFFFLFHLLLPVLWFFNLRKKIKLQQPYLTLDKDKEKSKQRQLEVKQAAWSYLQATAPSPLMTRLDLNSSAAYGISSPPESSSWDVCLTGFSNQSVLRLLNSFRIRWIAGVKYNCLYKLINLYSCICVWERKRKKQLNERYLLFAEEMNEEKEEKNVGKSRENQKSFDP